MATLGAMALEVLDRLGRGRPSNTYLLNQAKRQIGREFKTLCGKRDWHWKRAVTTIAASASDTYIDLPTVSKAGATVSRVHRVKAVQLVSSGKFLHHRPELLDLIATGTSLALIGRGVPDYWCIAAEDTTGVKKLMVMPLLGYAETLTVWFTRSAASMALVADSDTPPFDDEYEGYLIEKSVAALAASDATMEPQVASMALGQAMEIYRAMCLTERKAAPIVETVPWLGHGTVG